MGCWSSRI